MVDGELLGKLFNWQVAAWAAFWLNVVAWLKVRNERQRDIAKEKGEGWARLHAEIVRLDERCDHLQEEVDECRKREGEWMHRAIVAEAASEGIGEARQAAQRIVSTERVEKPKPGSS